MQIITMSVLNWSGVEDVALSWITSDDRQHPTSAAFAQSPASADVIPDVSGLDFFRKYPPPRSRPFNNGHGSGTTDRPVWRRLRAGSELNNGVSRLRPQSALRRPTGDPTHSDRSNFGRESKIAVLASVVACFFVALALTLTAVWLRLRRRVLQTASKPAYCSHANTPCD